MSPTQRRNLLFLLFLIVLAIHSFLFARDFSVLVRNGVLYDDSFYAFQIARNIAEGNGITFDGIHPTTGFQPLYVFLLVPVFFLFKSDPITPIYIALASSAVMTSFSALLLFKLLEKRVRITVAFIAMIVWAISPIVSRQSVNGLESSLALLLLIGLIYQYVENLRPIKSPSGFHLAATGVLAGFSVLARIDSFIFLAVLLLDYLLVLRARSAQKKDLGKILITMIVAASICAPWSLYGLATGGGLVPDGGTATRYLSMACAPIFHIGSADLLASGPDANFIWQHLLHSLSVLKASPPFHGFFRLAEKLDPNLNLNGNLVIATDALGFIGLMLFVYVVIIRRKTIGVPGFGELRFLIVYSGLLVAAYSFYTFGIFFFTRYYYPLYMISCIFFAFSLEAILQRFRVRRVLERSLCLALLLGYLTAYLYMTYTFVYHSRPIYRFVDMVQWIEENTSSDDRIGVFQSGAIGYFSDRKVLNLDGKVNREALVALKKDETVAYAREEGISIIMDHIDVCDLFLMRGHD